MNSLSGNASHRPSSSSSASLNSYQFDFDLGLSGRGAASSRPLKDQKPPPASAPKPAPTPSWTPQPSKPSWTHQPAPVARSGLSDTPSSMVGDIFGKSWASAAPSSASRIGIPDKNPNLFGDLLGSALGQSKASAAAGGNVPLKASAPRNSYSMDSLSDSLPKTTPATTTTTASNNPMKPSWRSTDNLNNYPSAMKSSPAVPMKTKKDPFESLVGFGSKPSGNPPLSSVKPVAASGTGGGSDYSFAAFQNATADDFAKSAQVFPPPPAFQNANTNAFGMPPQPQPKQEKSGMDPLDMLFSSPSPASSTTAASTPAVAPEINDWDLGSEFGGNDSSSVGTTTELEGLPPPPVGVTASAAKTKGLDNYKQGQYADAIKWLTWAVVLFDKSGDNSGIIEVLSCRASCYKEVGEYKKAVADCSKVLEDDSTNVSVLLQRALLYESTEKYKLGAEDLRMVLKIDPGNRLARSTIHRLNKLAD